MFDQMVSTARAAKGVAAVGAWARVENAACARRLAASAQTLERKLAEAGAEDREQWCLDNWDMVAAEIAASQEVSLGVASHQLMVAYCLYERLPQVAEVFSAGTISYRMVAAVVARTLLIRDRQAMADVDRALAEHIGGWGPLSAVKTNNAIDYWVDRFDPAAVRRTELSAVSRDVTVDCPKDGSGLGHLQATLLATDAEALDRRLDEMAAAVCPADPRTNQQRRSDALGVFGHGGDRLSCKCGAPDCPAADAQPSAVVIHVVADEESLDDPTEAELDGAGPPKPTVEELRQMTLREALTTPPGNGPSACGPAVIMGGAILPSPLLAAKIAGNAKIVPIVHPGRSAPEPRYTPSRALAAFVRSRDLTCRFPGCDVPADRCDIDHTIPYPNGPTQASNLKCECRKHHLLKTFGGWRDEQLTEGTVICTSPNGQQYTTYPGSLLLFPSLCRPTAPVAATRDEVAEAHPARTQAMPRRTRTRAENRERAIAEERARNQQARETGDRPKPTRPPQNTEYDWNSIIFDSSPAPPDDDDPPPF